MTHSHDPILNIFAMGRKSAPNFESPSENDRELRSYPEDIDIYLFDNDLIPEPLRHRISLNPGDEQQFEKWYQELSGKNRQYYERYRNSKSTHTERQGEDSREQSTILAGEKVEYDDGEKELLYRNWELINLEIFFLPESKMRMMSRLRTKIEKVKGLLDVYERQLGMKDYKNNEFQCRYCLEVFKNGKSLGGHISKKHPGFSQEYRKRIYLHKNKALERTRRRYFLGQRTRKHERKQSGDHEEEP